METHHENKELEFSKVLRVSHVYGVRFWSIVGLILAFMSLLGWGLLSLLDLLWKRTPEGAHEALWLLALVIWLVGSSALVQWAYEKIWRRPVVIRDLGSQVAISVGDREDRHSWSDLVKVKMHRYRVGRTGQTRVKSLNLVLTFQGRSYRLGTDEHQRQLENLQNYCQRKILQNGSAYYQ